MELRQPSPKNSSEAGKCEQFLTSALIALALTASAAGGADNSLGTWKLDLEKSTYTPAPVPVKSLTITREAADGGVKVTMTGEMADGTPLNSSYTAKYDGTDAQVTGNAPFDTIAIKQKNARTLTDARKKTGGSYKASGRTVISNDGKTMTTTSKGMNTEGKEFNSTFVYAKQ